MRGFLLSIVLGVAACGGDTGPLPLDGGLHGGRDGGVGTGRDGGAPFPDAVKFDAGKLDAPSLFDASL